MNEPSKTAQFDVRYVPTNAAGGGVPTFGCGTAILYTYWMTCQACHGLGWVPVSTEFGGGQCITNQTCSACAGKGSYEVRASEMPAPATQLFDQETRIRNLESMLIQLQWKNTDLEKRVQELEENPVDPMETD